MNRWLQELDSPWTIRGDEQYVTLLAALLPEAGYSLFLSIHFLLLPLSNTGDSHSNMADPMAAQRLHFPASLQHFA